MKIKITTMNLPRVEFDDLYGAKGFIEESPIAIASSSSEALARYLRKHPNDERCVETRLISQMTERQREWIENEVFEVV